MTIRMLLQLITLSIKKAQKILEEQQQQQPLSPVLLNILGNPQLTNELNSQELNNINIVVSIDACRFKENTLETNSTPEKIFLHLGRPGLFARFFRKFEQSKLILVVNSDSDKIKSQIFLDDKSIYEHEMMKKG